MPATKLWQKPTYFQKFSKQPIEVEVSPHDSSDYGTRHETSLGEFIELLSRPLPYRIYMSQVPLFQKVPRLQKDVTTSLVEEILAEGELYNTSTWIGTRSLTPLHRDPRVLTNLFVQVCGRKEFRMYHPEISTKKLRLGEGTKRNTANTNVWKEDVGEGLQGVVSAGDGIIIPRGWWHSVRSQEEEINISVNWWFKLRQRT
jgi:hypothetical protein